MIIGNLKPGDMFHTLECPEAIYLILESDIPAVVKRIGTRDIDGKIRYSMKSFTLRASPLAQIKLIR